MSNTAPMGDPTMFIDGNTLNSGSIIQWNGTTGVSSGQITINPNGPFTTTEFSFKPKPLIDIDWDEVHTISDMKKIFKKVELAIRIPLDDIEGVEKFCKARVEDFDAMEIVKLLNRGVKFYKNDEIQEG